MSEEKETARQIIEGYDGPAVRIMEVCGTHTHEIFRLGIRKLLPKQVELIQNVLSLMPCSAKICGREYHRQSFKTEYYITQYCKYQGFCAQ